MASNWTKINVYEEDQFAFSNTPEYMNSVYIPGFSSADTNETDSNGNKFRAQPRVPMVCTNLGLFKTLFGNNPAKFVQDVKYSDIGGFDSDCYENINDNIVENQDLDKAYIMACELLQLGLPVIYERINTTDVSSGLTASDLQKFYKSLSESDPTNSVKEYTLQIVLNESWILEVEGVPTATIPVSNYPITSGSTPTVSKITDGTSSTNKQDNTTITIGLDNKSLVIANGSSESKKLRAGFIVTVTYSVTISVDYDPVFPVTIDSQDLSTYSKLMDKNDYLLKFVTTGGYPVLQYLGNLIVTGMLTLCEARGDCIALIDHTDYAGRPLFGSGSVIEYLRNNPIMKANTFGAVFTPWATYNVSGLYRQSDENETAVYINEIKMPASFAYLECMANTITSSYDWLSIAGVTRGACTALKELNIENKLTNAIAEYYLDTTEVNINGITEIGSYGYCIWGNRTLHNNKNDKLVGLSFLNLRNVVCDVKKLAYVVARELMFEQNSDILWVSFVDGMSELLDQMTTGNALKTYKILLNTQDPNNGKDIPPFRLSATIRLYPVFAVEYFDIYVVLTNDNELEVSTESSNE